MLGKQDEALLRAKFAPFGLSQTDMNALVSGADVLRYEAGRVLYKDARSCYGFFIVKSGVLRAFVLSPNAKEITIFKLKSGEECIICSACASDSLQLEINLEVQEDLEIIVISPAIFSALRQKYQSLTNYALALISRRFAQSINVMQQALFLPLTERIRDFLVQNAVEGELKLTHETIANELGSAREAVSRILKEMEKLGEIELSRGKIKLMA